MRRFDGVIACDRLPTKPRLLVCNTDKSDEPGEHWIAIYGDDDGRYRQYIHSGALQIGLLLLLLLLLL